MLKTNEDALNGSLGNGASALRVQGEFDLSHDFFTFIAKFGFQKTDIRDPNNTQGLIYGNITSITRYNSHQQLFDNATEGKNSG